MRTVAEVPHPSMKITIFNYNEKFQIQLEAGPFKQTFSIPNDKVQSVDQLKAMLDEEFLDKSETLMDQMFANFKGTIDRHLLP